MSKLRQREIKDCFQGHRAGRKANGISHFGNYLAVAVTILFAHLF